MSATGIKVATTTTTSKVIKAAVGYEDGVNQNRENTANETDCALISSHEENSSFCTLPSLKELQTSLYRDVTLQQNTVPLENSTQNAHQQTEIELQNTILTSNRDLDDFPNSQFRQNHVETATTQLCPGLNLLQQTVAASSSPPPHSYRHSRAYRHFKNPPQPHMCIRTTTEAGEELFINVLSWTRIVIPQEPSDPIPLYGGMRVPPGSPRSPPIVFAVMANPEVLKDSGRHSKDPEERRAMVELMCDFVEAMNPGVKLVRNAIILKDRDISGELKDVWNAVQVQRDREREEQILLQRQQHFHNISNASTNGSSILNPSPTSLSNNGAASAATAQQTASKSDISNESISKTVAERTPPRHRRNFPEVQSDITSNIDLEKDIEATKMNSCPVSLSLLTEHINNKMSIAASETNEECNVAIQQTISNNQNALTNDALNSGNNSKDSPALEKTGKRDNQATAVNYKKDVKREQQANGFILNCHNTEISNCSQKLLDTTITSHNAATSNPAQTLLTTTITPLYTAPAKKEKLGGFLPNGCIFPRFTKNNKHKDKDKEKEPKTKDKEKNALLSALKKSKDKKTQAAANSDEKITSSNSKIIATNYNNSNSKQQKNCLQSSECVVQKFDSSNHHHHHHIHIDENNINNSAPSLSATEPSETSKQTTSSTITNSDGVGVH